MARPVVHVIGAGLAGLAAAVKLAPAPCEVVVHEAARQAGGRCRSFFDETMDATIDNGNHLLLSGNDSALAYLDTIGARDELRGPARCEIAFADMASGERWTLRPNEGRLPWWVLFEQRRVPRTRAADYLSVVRFCAEPRDSRGSPTRWPVPARSISVSGARCSSPRSTPSRAAPPPRWRRRLCGRRWRAAGAPVIRWWRPTACRAPSSTPR